MEYKNSVTFLTKGEFQNFVKEYNDFNEKNKSEFENKNEKLLELISKLDQFKTSIARC